MNLIVVESPNKVADVQKYVEKLGMRAKVTATAGHLLDLPPMKEGPGVNTTTFMPERLAPRDDRAADRLQRLRAAIASADRVIVATDPDREGEAIAGQVWPLVPRGRAWRATFEEITLKGVERGLQAMQPQLKEDLAAAAAARRVIDRLAGWHGTALVFEKLPQHRGISAGRLQSAALRLVVERHREHRDFKPATTYGLRVRLGTAAGAEVFARLMGADGQKRVFRTDAEARAFSVPKRLVVGGVQAEKRSQKPRPPFEATSWLQVAQKALGMSVDQACAATQALFEGGQTTYPRTDSVRVSEEAIEWARAEIARRFGPAYVPAKPWEHKDRSAETQGAHEAIRPAVPHQPSELELRRQGEWAAAYALIEARFLSSQAAGRVVEETVVSLNGGDSHWEAAGVVEVFDGWRRVANTDAEEEGEKAEKTKPGDEDKDSDPAGALPPLRVGDDLQVLGVEVVAHTTQPPPLFTQASLVAQLQRLGIGRPSTYRSLVPLILTRGWASEEAPASEKGKKRKKGLPVIVPTPVGTALCDFLQKAFPGLVDYSFTASLEQALDDVERGKRAGVEVAREWWARFEAELGVAKGLQAQLPERKVLGPCPRCSGEGREGRLVLVKGESRKTERPYEFAACDADSRGVEVCGYTAPALNGELQKLSPCPECRESMRPVRRKDGGHSWVCEQHGWFLAGRTWELVQPPRCPKCSQPMSHRERRDPKGEWFWGCFADKVFVSADRFGAVLEADVAGRGRSQAGRGKPGKAQR